MRYVLFDLDGTLIDTWHLYAAAYGAALAPHYGRPVTPADILALKPTSEYRLLEAAVGAEAAPACHRDFIGHYARFQDRCEGPYPGVVEMLSALRAAGYRLGLVTGKTRAAWEITAPRYPLGPFDVVVTDEQVRRPKPHPEGLRQALSALGAAPHEALYVGDSDADLAAARAAGMRFGAVLWSKGANERNAYAATARTGGAWRCLAQPADLPGALAAQPAGTEAS